MEPFTKTYDVVDSDRHQALVLVVEAYSTSALGVQYMEPLQQPTILQSVDTVDSLDSVGAIIDRLRWHHQRWNDTSVR